MAYSKQAASHFYRMRQFMQDNPGYFTFKQGQGMDWANKRERRAPRRGPWWEKVSLAARKLRRGIPASVSYSIPRRRSRSAGANVQTAKQERPKRDWLTGEKKKGAGEPKNKPQGGI